MLKENLLILRLSIRICKIQLMRRKLSASSQCFYLFLFLTNSLILILYSWLKPHRRISPPSWWKLYRSQVRVIILSRKSYIHMLRLHRHSLIWMSLVLHEKALLLKLSKFTRMNLKLTHSHSSRESPRKRSQNLILRSIDLLRNNSWKMEISLNLLKQMFGALGYYSVR